MSVITHDIPTSLRAVLEYDNTSFSYIVAHDNDGKLALIRSSGEKGVDETEGIIRRALCDDSYHKVSELAKDHHIILCNVDAEGRPTDATQNPEVITDSFAKRGIEAVVATNDKIFTINTGQTVERFLPILIPKGPQYDLMIQTLGSAAIDERSRHVSYSKESSQQAIWEAIMRQGHVKFVPADMVPDIKALEVTDKTRPSMLLPREFGMSVYDANRIVQITVPPEILIELGLSGETAESKLIELGIGGIHPSNKTVLYCDVDILKEGGIHIPRIPGPNSEARPFSECLTTDVTATSASASTSQIYTETAEHSATLTTTSELAI